MGTHTQTMAARLAAMVDELTELRKCVGATAREYTSECGGEDYMAGYDYALISSALSNATSILAALELKLSQRRRDDQP
jgi:hypothetical protein